MPSNPNTPEDTDRIQQNLKRNHLDDQLAWTDNDDEKKEEDRDSDPDLDDDEA